MGVILPGSRAGRDLRALVPSDRLTGMGQRVRVLDGPTQARHLRFVDGARGLACLWVVLDHLHVDALAQALPAGVARWVFDSGIVGVMVFFVLSGLVIARSWGGSFPGDEPTTAATVGRFLLRRWMRLSPPYYAAIVLAVVVTAVGAVVRDDGGQVPSVGSLVAHLLYVQGLVEVEPINAVFWTLAIEMQFYVAFGSLIWALRRLDAVSVELAQTAIVIVAAAAAVWPLRGLDLVNQPHLGAYAFAFASGAFTWWRWQQALDAGVYWLFHAILAVAWLRWGDPLVGAVVVTGPLLLEATRGDRMSRWLGGWPFQRLGALSYSLYLVHAPVTGVVDWAGEQVLGTGVAVEAVMIVPTIVASMIVAAILHRRVEEPALRWSRALRRPVAPVVVAP
jgi:peptidoglycan/LPS O-acetylase OafA/YrhL